MIGSFKFKEIESSQFGLVCKSIGRPLLPAKRDRAVTLEAVSGVYDYGSSEYEPRRISMQISYIGSGFFDLREKAREIAAWLSSFTWEKLIINDEPDKYHLARVISEINLEALKTLGKAVVTFECQPYAYKVNGELLDFTATGARSYAFTNPGTVPVSSSSPQGSMFKIIITGTLSSLTLSMNGSAISYQESLSSGTLVINNIDMEAEINGTNKLNVLSGDLDKFLQILPGENILEVSGANLNISVAIDYIPMWI